MYFQNFKQIKVTLDKLFIFLQQKTKFIPSPNYNAKIFKKKKRKKNCSFRRAFHSLSKQPQFVIEFVKYNAATIVRHMSTCSRLVLKVNYLVSFVFFPFHTFIFISPFFRMLGNAFHCESTWTLNLNNYTAKSFYRDAKLSRKKIKNERFLIGLKVNRF